MARAHGSYPWCREFKSPFRYFPGTLRCFESISGFFADFAEKVTDYSLTNSIAMSPLLFAAFKVLGPPAFEAGSVFSPFLFSICRLFPTARLSKEMSPYFKSEELSRIYVNENIERKIRNLIARRIRLTRKANLQDFNYFVTFTYDGKLHTEDSFRKGLKNCLRHLVERKQWKYIGVWERSPEKQRLHFHGIFYIPEGTMPGILLDVNDYNFNTHNRQITHQNTYFNERFGRSDFELIDDIAKMSDALAYIMKYIEKSGEKIVYSKGLPQFFISDVMDEDIICFTGLEDKKLLLSDDFTCWDEGCYVGKVSKAVIAQLRKCN